MLQSCCSASAILDTPHIPPLLALCRTFILFAVQALLGAAAATQNLVRAAGPAGGHEHNKRHPASAEEGSSPRGCCVGPWPDPGAAAAAEGSSTNLGGSGQHHPAAAAWGFSSIREFTPLDKLFSTLFVTVLSNELAIMVLYCGCLIHLPHLLLNTVFYIPRLCTRLTCP